MWPFSRPKPPIEQKSLAAPNEELLAILGATATGTAAVSASVALTVPAVRAAIGVVSESAASLEIKVQRREGRKWLDDEEHPAWHLLRGDACDWSSGFEFIRDITAEALIRNEGGLAWVNRVEGKPVEIIHYRDAVISVEYEDTGEPKYRLSGKPVSARDIVHLRGPFSKSPLNLAAEAIGVAHVMEKHAAGLFMRGARPGGVIEHPGKIGDTGVRAMLQGWNSAFGGADNAGKTALLYEGARYNQIALSSVDAQFLELRKYQTDEIARAFRVPPSMIYSLDRATWSNSEQMGREFLTYTLEPWLRALEAALTRALIDPSDRKDFRIWFERDDLTRADLGARATAYSSLVTARVYSPNELREWDGMPPYKGGDEFANPAITPGPQPANDNNKEAANAA